MTQSVSPGGAGAPAASYDPRRPYSARLTLEPGFPQALAGWLDPAAGAFGGAGAGGAEVGGDLRSAGYAVGAVWLSARADGPEADAGPSGVLARRFRPAAGGGLVEARFWPTEAFARAAPLALTDPARLVDPAGAALLTSSEAELTAALAERTPDAADERGAALLAEAMAAADGGVFGPGAIASSAAFWRAMGVLAGRLPPGLRPLLSAAAGRVPPLTQAALRWTENGRSAEGADRDGETENASAPASDALASVPAADAPDALGYGAAALIGAWDPAAAAGAVGRYVRRADQPPLEESAAGQFLVSPTAPPPPAPTSRSGAAARLDVTLGARVTEAVGGARLAPFGLARATGLAAAAGEDLDAPAWRRLAPDGAARPWRWLLLGDEDPAPTGPPTLRALGALGALERTVRAALPADTLTPFDSPAYAARRQRAGQRLGAALLADPEALIGPGGAPAAWITDPEVTGAALAARGRAGPPATDPHAPDDWSRLQSCLETLLACAPPDDPELGAIAAAARALADALSGARAGAALGAALEPAAAARQAAGLARDALETALQAASVHTLDCPGDGVTGDETVSDLAQGALFWRRLAQTAAARLTAPDRWRAALADWAGEAPKAAGVRRTSLGDDLAAVAGLPAVAAALGAEGPDGGEGRAAATRIAHIAAQALKTEGPSVGLAALTDGLLAWAAAAEAALADASTGAAKSVPEADAETAARLRAAAGPLFRVAETIAAALESRTAGAETLRARLVGALLRLDLAFATGDGASSADALLAPQPGEPAPAAGSTSRFSSGRPCAAALAAARDGAALGPLLLGLAPAPSAAESGRARGPYDHISGVSAGDAEAWRANSGAPGARLLAHRGLSHWRARFEAAAGSAVDDAPPPPLCSVLPGPDLPPETLTRLGRDAAEALLGLDAAILRAAAQVSAEQVSVAQVSAAQVSAAQVSAEQVAAEPAEGAAEGGDSGLGPFPASPHAAPARGAWLGEDVSWCLRELLALDLDPKRDAYAAARAHRPAPDSLRQGWSAMARLGRLKDADDPSLFFLFFATKALWLDAERRDPREPLSAPFLNHLREKSHTMRVGVGRAPTPTRGRLKAHLYLAAPDEKADAVDRLSDAAFAPRVERALFFLSLIRRRQGADRLLWAPLEVSPAEAARLEPPDAARPRLIRFLAAKSAETAPLAAAFLNVLARHNLILDPGWRSLVKDVAAAEKSA